MHSVFSDSEKRLSLHNLLRWLLIALTAALIASLTTRVFVYFYNLLLSLLQHSIVPLFLWPLAGALICGLIIYRICPHARGEGIPSYILGLVRDQGKLPPAVTLFKYPAAFATLASFGTGGLIGPLGRVNAGLLSGILNKQKILRVSEYDIRTGTICGLAATVALLTHSAVGGGIFAVEIIQKADLRYRDIFPAVITGSLAVMIARAFGWEPVFTVTAVQQQFSWTIIPFVLLVAIAGGLAGKLYIHVYRKTSLFLKREEKNRILLKVLAGSLCAALPAWLIHPDLIGPGTSLCQAIFSGQSSLFYAHLPAFVPPFVVLLLFFVFRMLANCLTVGSGMSAGFTTPAALCGIFIGAAAAFLFGIPAGTAEFHALAAAGFASVLASVMNVPLAASVIVLELFGPFYAPVAALAALMSFQINRQETIYEDTGSDG
ncbi:MAG: chloride channel protein [Spirochaetales bacterium]|nr:chloride channel protein [Spirochaetales bacterium]